MNRYFKGWYFKAQSETQTAAFIPAMHIDEKGKKSASLQIIADGGAWCAHYPFREFSFRGNTPHVGIGDSEFSGRGITLSVETGDISARGALKFGPLTPVRGDIMGPFRFVPFMECRHSVFSMSHSVSGSLDINGEAYKFDGGTGYIEGDRGRSFPRVYAWTQCNFFDGSPGSVMLSVAEIPLGAFRFTGIIGSIFWRRREYRITTYLGARAVEIGGGRISIKQGKYDFTAHLIEKQTRLLYAPVSGRMKRMIRESSSCAARYLFEENGEKLFEFETDRASFEYEYDR